MILNGNIHNLTSLWRTVGISAGRYSEFEYFCCSRVPGAQWPNRIWLKTTVSEDVLNEIRSFAHQSEQPFTISYWSDFNDKELLLFEQHGFQTTVVQTGMSLDVKSRIEEHNRVRLKRISTIDEAQIWEVLYPQSFGYVIAAETVIQTKDQVRYYLIYLDREPIGTAITFETGNTVGIHGMGIIPAYRKQGFAEEVMIKLMNQAFDEGKTRITLQASAMGKGVYEKIGFSADFLMTGYTSLRLDGFSNRVQ
ncbi:GNAT family N-acetyltransferase [Parapedobacter deserti]|uniref:GNAT family N-acetyltransferase n=1 Tax=Parapedobacter deserti TaxID=1912957 RepID=A0ABV7JIJ8_9SPHI